MKSRNDIDRLFAKFRDHGDPRALAKLFDRTAPELFRVATYLTGRHHRAEDLVQQTFLVALEHAKTHDPERGVLPWMLGILANRARDLARKERHNAPDDLQQQSFGSNDDPATAAENRELVQHLRASIDSIDAPFREVLVLHLFHGLSAKEIGEALNRPAGTVRTQVSRGMERLRRSLPAGLAGLGAWTIASPKSLAAAREAVLTSKWAAAGTITEIAAKATAPSTVLFGLSGGLLTMKTLSIFVAAITLVFVSWLFVRDPGTPHADPNKAAFTNATSEPAGSKPNRESVDETSRSLTTPAKSDPKDANVPMHPSTGASPALDVVVVYDADGEPAPHSLVGLLPHVPDRAVHERWVAADSTGHCAFEDLPRGPWTITTDRGGESVFEFDPNTHQQVEVRIPVGIQVTGQVVDRHGAPIAGARIWLSSRANTVDDGMIVTTAGSGGRFLLDHVPPKRGIAALAKGYYSSNIHVLAAEPGQSVDIELELPLTARRLHGLVRGSDGRPVANALVHAGYSQDNIGPIFIDEEFGYGEEPGRRTRTDAKGHFELLGITGTDPVPLYVRASDHSVWKEEVAVKPDADTYVLVNLRPGASVWGRVTKEDGSPVSGETITTFQSGVEPGRNTTYQGPPWARRSAVTDVDGAFRLDHLQAGSVSLRIQTEEGAATITYELVDGDSRTWNAVLRGSLTIEGTVTDIRGTPLENYRVYAAHHEKGVTEPSRVTTGSDGRFALEGGDDREFVLKVRDTHGMMDLEAIAISNVRPGDPPINVVVPDDQLATSFVEGIFHDPSGASCSNVWLQVRRSDKAGSGGSGTAEIKNGRHRTGPFVPGRYRIHARAKGYSTLDLGEHLLRPREVCDLGTFSFQEPGTVTVKLFDQNGKPIDRGMIIIARRGSSWGDITMVKDGEGSSGPLQPGEHTVQPWGNGVHLAMVSVTVRPGENAEAELRLSESVRRTVLLPVVPSPGLVVAQIWTNSASVEVRHHSSILSNVDAPIEEDLLLVPDTYQVDLIGPFGQRSRTEVVVDRQTEGAANVILKSPWD